MPGLITYRTVIEPTWVDYNGHLRDAYYLLIFSYATDAFMAHIGLDEHGREQKGHSLFTLEAHLNFLHEVKLSTAVWVETHIVAFDRKRVQLYHTLHRAGFADALAASDQMLLHVDLAGPRSAPFADESRRRLETIMAAQDAATELTFVGRRIELAPS